MLPRPIRQTELQPTSRGWLTLPRARRATRPLILLALLFLSLLGCGQLALWVNAPTVNADTRSQLAADYGPWSFTIIHPVDPAIIEEILRDEGAASAGSFVVEAGGFWPTPTAPTRETAFAPATQTPLPVAFSVPTDTPPPPATTASPALSPTSTAMALPTSTTPPLPTRAATRTRTPAPVTTATWTSTPILAPTSTETSAPAPTSTFAPPPSPVNTATSTAAPTATLTSTATGTATATATPTASNTPASTPTVTDTPTITPTPSDTPTPTFTPIPTSTATATDTPTSAPGPCPGNIPPGEPEVIPPASSPDGEVARVACGTAIIVDLGANPVVITGSMDPDYDLVYYVRDTGGGIMLDWVIMDACADASCSTAYTIFYWGNATADTNTNIGVAGYGPPESDNQVIPSTDLWGSTGIAIDVDMVAPAGAYQWIRIYAPLGGPNDPCEVDALEVLP